MGRNIPPGGRKSHLGGRGRVETYHLREKKGRQAVYRREKSNKTEIGEREKIETKNRNKKTEIRDAIMDDEKKMKKT